ncbi:MAG: preprotein translocase subunit SecG [Nisaea sp.]|jgi:preprotein translocase subunit SecG|nr:preprotein translocase subunit SecG [Nisaea sp.]MDA8573975.1 preprotein translocase subunit SecG [Alphaproteobacteria bacterium]OUX99255.1 MAG: preprotein translocase subunit SecG [Candidatus Endolissoclinum sp. TMED26]
MIAVLLTIHLMIAIGLIVSILLQRSEGGGLGIGGGAGGGMGGFMSARGTANLLTRTTAVLAALFMSMSILLAILSDNGSRSSIVDQVTQPTTTQTTPSVPQAPVGN